MNIVKSLFQSSIGRKYIMAVTGGLLFGFLVVHLAGNVQIFLGADRINSYAALLKSNLLVLWGFRLGLAAIALIHITTATGLTLENWAARPNRYAANTDPYASFSARTMVVSGVILFAFITYHLLHFTLGVTQPGIMHHVDHLGRHDVYRMMLEGFRNPWIAGTYLAAMIVLFFHLRHGLSSLFQSLGLKNQKFAKGIEYLAVITALLICVGNGAIALTILLRILK